MQKQFWINTRNWAQQKKSLKVPSSFSAIIRTPQRNMDSMSIRIFREMCFGKNFMRPVQRVKRFLSEYFTRSHERIKVILTVRESDEKWWKSWCGFLKQESERFGFGGLNGGVFLNEGSDRFLTMGNRL